MNDNLGAPLTEREQEVLGLLRLGRANKEIADELGCTVRTVEFHVSNLLRKQRVSSRLELVARSQASGPKPLPAPPAGAPAIEARVFSGVALAALGDTILTVWSAPASPERWLWQSQYIREVGRAHADGVAVLSLILGSSSPPGRGLRAEMKRMFSEERSRLRLFVAIPLGDSVWAAIVRMVGRAVLLLQGQSDRQSVVGSLENGIARLRATATVSTPSDAEIYAAAAELTRLLRAEG